MVTPSADQAIARYRVLEEPGGRDLQALAELAALVCGVPNAAINLITRDHQHQVAAAGIDPSVCSREDSMCAVVLDDPAPVVAPDASVDPRFAENPFVSGEIDTVRFYASAPLVTPEGTTIGRLCVFDTEPHELAAERAAVLEVVAQRVVDVLELRLRSRQLELSQAELSRSNELLTLFAGQVSHDLRSPLTAILANTELLASEPAVVADPAVSELVTATYDAGRRMAGLIDTILGYARVGSEIERSVVPLDEVLDHVLDDLGPVLAQRSARIARAPLPEVVGDPTLLYTVLQNLVANAVKFTPPDRTPEVQVAATRDGDGWRVTVTDNGRGIPPADRDQVFALHARGDRSVQGSGIGLATARRAVEAHGGRIGVDDAPTGGAVVWLVLPDIHDKE
ncbi:signal transduction histidine kinase [Nocardioides aromaticivorans]|uniref:Sensor-like histidine kinase SenX3 n=1 Tax=Nocardioides aromaticivorans TaxID=200618 RepID=A0A7Z0CP09_9ACTN|nr:GAF domain-containing sensor histidine kinase [Nocardioides aromaticivorans]NYI45362.1 signal transduction histidine kinase [Nocardioides aromaticivorans]